ncbi:hypothetical protein [Sedimenticola selenatireducens]|uniref:Uncharacterized protein n=1 Tax=Sedimenticola selenatireducens TaxID=191960 RepID=A0A558E1C6_9GAMM|nr:hypothetical protein [Sedimenticola selenatireducens]TVO75165.1 hypothetical protein FHP88_09125 [Sedimenticola selenatireducens]TVT66980.1 MAG: hypothetical protein FHK78_01230 [Sedimenticola selenatireducens]
MRYRVIIPLLMILPLAGQAMTGGPCRYTPVETDGQVTAATDLEVQLATNALGPVTLERKHFPIMPSVGSRYHLQLQTLSEGACNPFQVTGLAPSAPAN